MKRAVFLDRDGVLNSVTVVDGFPCPPRTLGQFKIVDGAAHVLKKLKSRGFLNIVCTNQPDVGRGVITKELVESFHTKLRKDLGTIDHIQVCYHSDEDQCECRKPKPGMILEAAKAFDVDLSK